MLAITITTTITITITIVPFGSLNKDRWMDVKALGPGEPCLELVSHSLHLGVDTWTLGQSKSIRWTVNVRLCSCRKKSFFPSPFFSNFI